MVSKEVRDAVRSWVEFTKNLGSLVINLNIWLRRRADAEDAAEDADDRDD